MNKIELEYLTIEDYNEIKEMMIESYSSMRDAYWKESHIEKLINIFPEGQVGIKIDGELAGCALSIIIQSNKFSDNHTYLEITGNYTFDTHAAKGDALRLALELDPVGPGQRAALRVKSANFAHRVDGEDTAAVHHRRGIETPGAAAARTN